MDRPIWQTYAAARASSTQTHLQEASLLQSGDLSQSLSPLDSVDTGSKSKTSGEFTAEQPFIPLGETPVPYRLIGWQSIGLSILTTHTQTGAYPRSLDGSS